MPWPKGRKRTGMKYAPSFRTHKICVVCGTEKPRTIEFYSFSKRGYPQSRCRECQCPSGITMKIRIENAKKKAIHVIKTFSFARGLQVNKQPYFHITTDAMCICCKKKFKAENNRQKKYCSMECKKDYQDYNRYQKFLGLEDFSAGSY